MRAQELAAPRVHPDLMAVSAQYFHAFHRGGFDAYRGGAIFPWFDLFDLEHSVIAPPSSRISASSRSMLFVVGHDGRLGALRRGETRPRWLASGWYPEEAIENEGQQWVLARSTAGHGVIHVKPDGAFSVRQVAGREVRVAIVGEQPAVAWLSRDGGHLRVHVALSDRTEVVDEVELPPAVAELAERSGVDLALTAHGNGLAVAWRPLSDPSYRDVGSESEPPTTPSRAEVRWMIVSPDPRVQRHATSAQPLGAVTGEGPWPLAGNGMKAATVDGRALFVWLEEDRVMGVLADDAAPTRLADSSSAPLIAFRDREGGAVEMLLFDSTPRVRAFAVDCE